MPVDVLVLGIEFIESAIIGKNLKYQRKYEKLGLVRRMGCGTALKEGSEQENQDD